MKNSITREEYLQLVGLETLARVWQKRMDDLCKCMAVVLETNEEDGHVSDVVYGGRDLTWLLSSLEIDVPEVYPSPTQNCSSERK